MSLTTKKIAAVWRALKTVVQLNPSSVQALVFPLKGVGGGWGGGEVGEKLVHMDEVWFVPASFYCY